MNATRRTLLRATALAAPAALLVGCAPNGSITASQIAQYATVAENAAADVLKAIPATALTTTISSYLTQVQQASAALAAGLPAAGASWQQQLYDGIKATLPVVAPLLGTVPGVSLGLAALQAILPIVAGWLGLTGAPVAPELVKGIPPMTPAQALKLYGPGA